MVYCLETLLALAEEVLRNNVGFSCLVCRSTAELTDVIRNAQSLTIYINRKDFITGVPSVCVSFAEPLYGLVTTCVFVMISEWLSWGVSLDKKMGPVVYQVPNFCKYLTKTCNLMWYCCPL